jgi:bacterial/archaeal transporter family protein
VLRWLIPTLVYVLAVGALGVFGKLALRDLTWQDTVLWLGAGYVVVCSVLLASGQAEIKVGAGTGWAIAAAAMAITGMIALYLALGEGKAGTVTAISAAYPVVTLILAALFLSEGLTLGRGLGASLVVLGVVVLTATE